MSNKNKIIALFWPFDGNIDGEAQTLSRERIENSDNEWRERERERSEG